MKTIMIADDDSAILALLSYTFESDGFKVTSSKQWSRGPRPCNKAKL
jgi:DNA-binding response OmpR family regulator